MSSQPAMHDRTQEGLHLLDRLAELHRDVASYVITVRKELAEGRLSQENLVDAAYVLQELNRLSEDVRKDTHVLGETVEKTVCAVWLAMNAGDPEARLVRGEHAQGSPGMRLAANLPARGSPERDQLLQYLGVPQASRQLVTPDWRRLSEEIDRLASEGRPPPPGIPAESTYPVYSLGGLRPIKKA